MTTQEKTVFTHACGARLIVSSFVMGQHKGREGLYVVVDHPNQDEALWRTFVGPVASTPQEDIDAAMQMAQAVALRQLQEWQRQWFLALAVEGMVPPVPKKLRRASPMPPAPHAIKNIHWQRQARFKG